MKSIERETLMKRSFSAVFAILLAIAVQDAGAQGFPAGDVFNPLVADPIEPRNFLSVLATDSERAQTTLGSVGLGVNFGLYRWAGQTPRDGWQVGIFAAFNSQFDLEADSYPLVNTDYRVGIPLSFRRGDFSGRARIFHQSSHLGDEVILTGTAPQRVNLSVEIVDFVLAWERAGWRPYAGGLYILHRDPKDLGQGGVQAGVDYVGTKPVLFGARLVGGVDYRALQATDWRGGLSAKVGLEFGRPRPERRGLTVLLEYFDGSAPFGQFYRDVVSYYGVGVQLDY
jgi:hypothetical protein